MHASNIQAERNVRDTAVYSRKKVYNGLQYCMQFEIAWSSIERTETPTLEEIEASGIYDYSHASRKLKEVTGCYIDFSI